MGFDDVERTGPKGNYMNQMQQMMKQARKMQAQMEVAQAELATTEITASAGGGMVKATATGDLKIKAIEISPIAVDPEDVEMLQDMVTAAVNEALAQAQELASSRMNGITGGLNIPGM